MNRWNQNRKVGLLLAVGLLLVPTMSQACTACYGQSDSPMAQGMNWGIMSLLAVIGCVLAGIASFFVYVGWKSSQNHSGASGKSSASEN